MTYKLNVQLAHNQKIISINIKTNEEKTYISIKTASIELEIDDTDIFLKSVYKEKVANQPLQKRMEISIDEVIRIWTKRA